MNVKSLFVITIVALLVAGVGLWLNCYFIIRGQLAVSEVCFSPPTGGCFEVEVAESSRELEKGLMFRKSLDQNKGMLFIFEKEENHPFWMKNTFIALDIIWLESNRKVVFLKENAQPCLQKDCPLINPGVNAKYVLEINAGLAEKIGLRIGDGLDFNF